MPSTSRPLAISSALRGEVDAVEARPLHRRRGDAHVHLERAGLAQHPHQRALGVAAHDRVVDDDQPLAADDVAQRVELEPDAELADRLRRLDERASDVGVLDQPEAVRDAGRLGVADRGRRAGLGHRDDQVGLDRMLAGPAGGRPRPGSSARCGRRSWCPAGPGRRTRTGSPWARARAKCCERRPSSSIAISSPGSISRTKLAPTMSSAAVSEVTTQPRSRRPSTSGRTPCGSRAA